MITGKVIKFGDNIDTDVILPGPYLVHTDPNELAKHAMEGLDPKFPQKAAEGVHTIRKLRDIASQFESLLVHAEREEELQAFLKENPMVLHPTAEVIPKKKLGEDFITDFVLFTPSDQGPTYTLVEIEKSSHPILVRNNSLSSQTNHALKQTRDWDVWLEQNKAYIQGKLPGFETPKYIVVIGRGNNLNDIAKAYLRSYNREWKNIELLTFDDVLVRFNGVISALNAAIGSSSDDK